MSTGFVPQLAKVASDGFHGRDNLEGEKVLVQSIFTWSTLFKDTAAVVDSWVLLLGLEMCSRTITFVYILMGKQRWGEIASPCYFIAKIPVAMEAFGNILIFRQAVPTHVKCF